QLRNGGALSVGLLSRREFAELGVTLQIEIGIGQIGLVLRLFGFRLVEDCLIRPGVDLGEQVSLVDQLPLFEGDLVDLAIDAGPDNDRVEALDRPEARSEERRVGKEGRSRWLICGYDKTK